MIEDRERRKVILTKHFFEQAYSRKLFGSLERTSEIVTRALHKTGLLIPALNNKCDMLCILKTDTDLYAVCPVICKNNLFIVKSIWKAPDYHRKLYLKTKRNK